MAHVQTAIETHPVFDKVAGPFRAIGGWLVRLSEANLRVRELERLSAMNDAELSKVGLKREDIVRHVYRASL